MSDQSNQGWEPDPRKMGNWRSMFEQPRRDGQPPGQSPPQPANASAYDDGGPGDIPDFDPTLYRPWILQRGRSRPAMMLELRRFQPRSGFWQGWAMPYHNLYAVEYVDNRMLTLDYGVRQFLIEGDSLSELASLLFQGTVLTIVEYNSALWPASKNGPAVMSIRRLGS